MSFTPSVTISLTSQPEGLAETHEKVNKTSNLENASKDADFGKMVEEAAPANADEAGKLLPKGPFSSGDTPVLLDLGIDHLNVRKQGQLTLVTGGQEVSPDSLVEFMQSQGLSRAEIAELLLQEGEKSTLDRSSALNPLTSDWLRFKSPSVSLDLTKLQSGDVVDEVVNSNAPQNLAAALLLQIEENQLAQSLSPVVEVFNIRGSLQAGQIAVHADSSEVDDVIRLADLLSVQGRKLGTQSGSSSSQNQSSSGGFSEQGGRLGTESASQQQPQMREFRDFLVDHLRRAENLQALSDRMGTVIAQKMLAQIGRGRWSLEMALHPSELGSIKVEMEMTERGLEASFRASQHATRDLLMESMPRLKQWLEEGGINVAYTGLMQDPDSHGGEKPTDSDDETVLNPAISGVEMEDESMIDSDLGPEVDGYPGFDIRV